MKNCEQHLVSIIVPVYNRQTTIKKTLDSVKNQDHRPLEIVLVDDGSTDDSLNVIRNWKIQNESDSLRVDITRQDNKGAPTARNVGIRKSEGDFIQFLDSDDIISPSKISSQISDLLKTEGEVSVCDFEYITPNGTSIRKVTNNANPVKQMASGGSISTMTPLIKARLIKNIISWEENLPQNQDIDFNLKVVLLSQKTIKTPGSWCFYIIHGENQISSGYQNRIPPFFIRFKSITSFVFKNWKIIPKQNKPYAIKSAAKIILKALRFWLTVYPVRNFKNLNLKTKKL